MDPSSITQAAKSGDIDSLYLIIQQDVYILDKIDQIPFIDTPMHVAASEGKIEFVMEMMNLKPWFARKLNPAGLSPMHVALKQRRNCTPLVVQLLKADKTLARVKGREGKTPFHVAVEQGSTELAMKFLEACPECIEDVTVAGETALHIALKKKHYKTLKKMMGWLLRSRHPKASCWESQILNWVSNEGKTALDIGLAASTDNNPQTHKIVDIIHRAGGHKSEELAAKKTAAVSHRSRRYWNEKILIQLTRQSRNMSGDMRNALLVVAVLIITATYQASLSPPGSVWQVDNSPSSEKLGSQLVGGVVPAAASHGAGTTVMGMGAFSVLWTFNTISLWIALAVTTHLLPGGLYGWFLFVPLSFLSVCYLTATMVLQRNSVWVVVNCAFSFCFYTFLLRLFNDHQRYL